MSGDAPTTDAKRHWERVYTTKAPDQLSWFEPTPTTSLALFRESGIGPGDSIIDVGGGASHLAGELLRRGYRDVTVADISRAALERTRSDIGVGATEVSIVEADVRRHRFGREFDLWHDRAVLHFMVDRGDRDAYLRTLSESLRAGGFLILATFGPRGPEQCSGLPVTRYSAADMARLLAEDFTLLSSRLQAHGTPSGREQEFQYALFRRDR